MNLKNHIIILALSLSVFTGFSQNYQLKSADFNTGHSDFAPTMLNESVVFTSNKPVNGNKSGFSNIFRYDNDQIELMGSVFKTNYHDGPVSFAKNGKYACFSSNISTENKGKRLQVGLFFTELTDSGWTPALSFEFNDPQFSNAYPSLSEDGQTLYFSSTRPGGSGGTDIYMSYKLENGKWSTPENLGNAINTEKNESFPFYHESGRLYFSSNAGASFGGLDIFYSEYEDGKWSFPKILPEPLNSSADDFGICMNTNQTQGYLSSSRKKGRDMIYSFELKDPDKKKLSNPEQLSFERKCVTFFDNNPHKDDYTPHMSYIWKIDGNTYKSKEARHCFDQPGTYNAELSVYDSLLNTESLVSNYEYTVRTEEKPIIEVLKDDSSKTKLVIRLIDLNLTNFRGDGVMWRINDQWYSGKQITIEDVIEGSSLLLIESNEDKNTYRCYEADLNQWIR